ncbi:ACT domain-containing protein [Sulfitobacter sp. S190]|uniref:ACT domain-containing protein n=1 Tax=Sulfitobacter sp. S190 TaxID=2867022 RepID=UPI0021A6A873|nr:ACT domain-containing protein [Sulfitobacter sp. S190]UWR23029.1 ACT domain-containing protein [Sulfitobacter sp. S190]
MSGEHDLDTLLATMTAKLAPETYVFVTLAPDAVPAGITPRMMFNEAEGVTLILTRDTAEHAGLEWEFACRMITLDVHSALEAVGFIARVASALAAAGMGVNPVSGFYHDHLFVPDGRQDDALAVIARIASEARA